MAVPGSINTEHTNTTFFSRLDNNSNPPPPRAKHTLRANGIGYIPGSPEGLIRPASCVYRSFFPRIVEDVRIFLLTAWQHFKVARHDHLKAKTSVRYTAEFEVVHDRATGS